MMRLGCCDALRTIRITETLRDNGPGRGSLVMGDDAIALFAKERACERITITNCTMESAASGIKIGGLHQNFRDITVSNCVMRNCMVGIGFYTKGEGCVERILFSNLTIGTIDDLAQVNEVIRNQVVPIFMDIDAWHHVPGAAVVRDISFANIAIDSEWGILIQGMDDNPIRHLTLRDISFRVRRGGDYARRKKPSGYFDDTPEIAAKRTAVYARAPSYVTIANVERLFMDHLDVIIPDDAAGRFPRSAVSLHRVNHAVVRSVTWIPGEDSRIQPVVSDEECRSAVVSP